MNAPAREIMLIRHVETVANVEGRYIGTSDSPITARGERQTRWLRSIVADWKPEAVYASPLGRALTTARAITPAGVRVSIVDALAEIDFGDAEGFTYRELQSRGITLDYASGGPIAPGGETERAFNERVRQATEVIESGPARVVVVTHGGMIRRMLTRWLGLPVEAGWRFSVPNAAAAVVRTCSPDRILVSLTLPPESDMD